ncbi:MAG: TonB-dependent receptor [Polyangiaceae bacterium]|nr:TonB-dependent receptor [Polyangiaceae bacterium]
MNRLLTTTLTFGVLSFVLDANADNELDALLSEEVITTASRTPESSRTAPGISTSITAEQLRIYGLRTVAEAIDFIAIGVSTAGPNDFGGEAELGSRGVMLTGDSGNHFLLMIDGHAINEVSRGTARFDRGAGIPLEVVDHIEVTVGPGSVLYGNNAMLGVVNVILKRGGEVDGGYLLAGASSMRSYRVGAAVGQDFKMFGEEGQLLLAAEHYERRGPEFSVGLQNAPETAGATTRTSRDNSQPGIWGGTLHDGNYAQVPAIVLAMDLGNFQLYGQAKHADFGNPMGPYLFDEEGSHQLDKSMWFDLRHRLVLPHGVDLISRVYVDAFSRRHVTMRDSFICAPDVGDVCEYEILNVSRWAGLELRTSIDWFEDESWLTSFGVDERVRYVGSRTDRLQESTGDRYTASLATFSRTDVAFGAYVQQLWNATDDLAFNVSARVDEGERYDPVVSPRAAVSLGVWEGGVAKIMYAKAFRAPGRLATDADVEERLPPDDLRPEIVQSGEITFEQAHAAHRALFGVFGSQWTDMTELHVLTRAERIARYGAGVDDYVPYEIDQLRNVGTIRSYGFNLGYRGSALDRQLSTSFSLTYAHSEEVRADGNRKLTVAPSLSGNARVAYFVADDWPTVGLAASYQGSRLANGAHSRDFVPIPEADEQLSLKATLSGWMGPMSYRVSADYAMTDHGPYTIGAVERGFPESPSAELNPVQQFIAFAEVSYEF